MKKTLQRKKNPDYPKNPQSIPQFKGYTMDGDFRFYVDTVITPNYDFTVFCSQYTIDFMNKDIPPGSRKFVIDGTFKKIPKGYYQLLIIALQYQNDVRISIIFINNASS